MSGRYKGQFVPEYVVNMEAAPAVYSTDELVVGVYMSKPLYRKIIRGVTNTENASVYYPVSSDIEAVLRGDVFVENSDSSIVSAPNQYVSMSIRNDGRLNLYVSTGGAYLYGRPFTAIIEYTKTTDTPVSNVNAVFPSGNYFIEEYDTDDGWHVRKHSDGYIEMFIYRVTEIVYDRVVDIEGGLSYFSNCFPQTTYPVPLVEKYQEVATIVPMNDVRYLAGWTNIRGVADQNSLLHTAAYSMMRQDRFPVTEDTWYTGVRVSVIGRWKNSESSASLASTPMIIPEFDFDIEAAPGSIASAAASTGLTFR